MIPAPITPELGTVSSATLGHSETIQMLREAGFVPVIDAFVYPCPRALRMERIVREQARELADEHGYESVVLVEPDTDAPVERSPINGAPLPKIFSVLVAGGLLDLES